MCRRELLHTHRKKGVITAYALTENPEYVTLSSVDHVIVVPAASRRPSGELAPEKRLLDISM